MRFFTSDLHLGHANIIGYCQRPFSGVEAMDRALLDRWRERVSPGDEVWVLGDVAMGRAWQDQLARIAELPGRKVLVPGNHDRCWAGHGAARSARFEADYRVAFDEVLHGPVETTLGAARVLVDHFPYTGGGREGRDKYANRRPVDRGLPLLHGHIHELWQVMGAQLNVGVDVWGFAPVPEAELAPLIMRALGEPRV